MGDPVFSLQLLKTRDRYVTLKCMQSAPRHQSQCTHGRVPSGAEKPTRGQKPPHRNGPKFKGRSPATGLRALCHPILILADVTTAGKASYITDGTKSTPSTTARELLTWHLALFKCLGNRRWCLPPNLEGINEPLVLSIKYGWLLDAKVNDCRKRGGDAGEGPEVRFRQWFRSNQPAAIRGCSFSRTVSQSRQGD